MKLYITICLIFFNLALIQNASCFVFHPDTLVKTPENSLENPENKTLSLNASLAVLNKLLNEETLDQDTSRSKELVNKTHSLFNKVKSESRVVEFVDFSRTQTLPLAINKNIGGLDYMIVFDSITLNPSGGLITSYMSLEVPQNGKRLAFRGGNIKFNRSGISANARLDLIEDFPIKIGEKTLMNLKADQRKTYVNFDCNGFTDMGVQAELEFSRDLIVPENTDGSLIPAPARVKGKFEVVQMREWGEILAKINLPAFQVNGLTGFGFKVTEAIFDFSETANALGVNFPQDYGSVDPLWQGVYIRNASISLPRQFKSTDRTRLEFFAKDFLIDDVGISGMIGAKNVLALDKGDMDSWKFSIDSLYLKLNRNQLQGGGLGGLMQVPLFGDDPLKYTASINVGGNYLFNVTMVGTKKIPLWAAEAQIYPGSAVEIRTIEDKFLPKIILNGKLTINGGDESEAKIADISFEQLQLQTIAPYIKIGFVKLSSEKLQQRMNNFPITIKSIGVISKENDIGLNLEVIVNFVGDGDAGFGGNGTFTVWGEQRRTNGRQQLRFKNVQINEIGIDIDNGGFKLKGLLVVYKKHSVYGKGFKGTIDATFSPGLQVKATAQFGTVNSYRYWYADALVTLPNGIMVAPGFGLYGFGGGAYYHMKRQVSKPVVLPSSDLNNPSVESPEAGRTVSGIVYIPDQTTALGIKATVVVGTYPTPQPFNGDATFEIAFNENNGVDFISFIGDAYFMTPIEKRSPNAPVYANLKIDYDVKNSSLFGNLNVFVNVAEGIVKGMGTDNSAGSATLYFSPESWFIHIGTPEKRIGLKMMHIFEAQSYMMVGTQMPGMPDVPDNVKHILKSDMQFMRDENAVRSGGGFAFGSSLHMSTGDLSFLVFYARLDAGAGFDMMLKNYGNDVRCSGRSEPLGINGWYASGQAYAWVSGKIGIRVDLTFVKGDFDIINLGAAAALQAKLPNPVWMRGTVGGYYSILGGLVSGQCKFEMTLGEQCQINGGSAVTGLKIIAELSPAANERKVNVFNAPQAAFNIPVSKIFELVDLDDQKKSFRVALDHFKVSEGDTEIQGKEEWNANHDVVAFKSFEILPPKKTIKISVRVHFEESVNGSWRPVLVNGKTVEELKESTFETGEAPDFVPASNVTYSYPCLNQYNFHKDESTQGYIQLTRGQSYLFSPSSEWKQVGRFQSGNVKQEFDFSYNVSERKIAFAIPSGLSNESIYTYQLLNVPAAANSKVDANVKTVVKGESDVLISTKEVEGTLNLLEEKPIFSSHIKTSKFSTFQSKIGSLSNGQGWIWDILTGVNELGTNISTSEYFDKYEVQGTNHTKPLIQYEAVLDNKWYTKEVYPLIYQEYPLGGNLAITWRKTDSLGIPPIRAIYLRQTPPDKVLVENEIESRSFGPFSNYAAFVYDLSLITYKDYHELRQKASVAIKDNKGNNAMSKLVASYYPILGSGKYRFKVRYVLPGTGKVTSEKEFTIVKP